MGRGHQIVAVGIVAEAVTTGAVIQTTVTSPLRQDQPISKYCLGPALEVGLADCPGIEVGLRGAETEQGSHILSHTFQQFIGPYLQA